MDRIRIHGGARLNGEIAISGAKNAALPLMAACLLSDEPLVLRNVPRLADIDLMEKLLQSFGVAVHHRSGAVALSADAIRNTTAVYDLVRQMRASFLVLGPLVARRAKPGFRFPAVARSARGPSIFTCARCLRLA